MKKIALIISAIVFIILCIVFSKFDLDISIYLTKFDGPFYEFFDDYGELPIYVGPILFGSIYYYLSEKTSYKFASAGITSLTYLIAVYKVFHNKEISMNLNSTSLIFTITTLLVLINFMVFSKIKKENLEKVKDLALVGLIATLVSITCIELLKLTWGRVRFRDLSSDYSKFTNLFTINGYTGNKSFPSGHTNAATNILLISLIVPRFTDKKWLKNLVIGLCFSYALLVAFSRIVVSAHYASDVLVGFVVGLLTISFVYYGLKRRGVIDVTSNKC